MRAGWGLVLLLGAGCGSFRGPGRFQTASDYRGSDYTGGGESVGALAPREVVAEPGGVRLSWPVARVRINRGYRPASDPKHAGVDLGGERGTPILAAHPGRVVYAGHDFHGYGNMVILEYDAHWATLYGHLDKISVGEVMEVPAGRSAGADGPHRARHRGSPALRSDARSHAGRSGPEPSRRVARAGDRAAQRRGRAKLNV